MFDKVGVYTAWEYCGFDVLIECSPYMPILKMGFNRRRNGWRAPELNAFFIFLFNFVFGIMPYKNMEMTYTNNPTISDVHMAYRIRFILQKASIDLQSSNIQGWFTKKAIRSSIFLGGHKRTHDIHEMWFPCRSWISTYAAYLKRTCRE